MSTSSFIVKTRNAFKKVATSLFTREVATFLFFLVLAFLFWVMHASSAPREMKVKVKMDYIGIPSNIQLLDSLPQTTTIVIKDRGSVLWQRYFDKLPPLQIDLSDQFTNKGILDYDLSDAIVKYMIQFPTSTQLYDYSNPNINLTYNTLETKTVPVAFRSHYDPLLPYVLKDSIRFYPNKIDIHAPVELIASIDTVYIHEIPTNLNKSANFKQEIIREAGVQYNINTIDVEVPIEISTEKRLELPIYLSDMPEGITIRTFPAEASVVFNVGISKFQSITENDFKVVLFYDSIKLNNAEKAKLYLIEVPSDIFQLRLIPNEVDYILECLIETKSK